MRAAAPVSLMRPGGANVHLLALFLVHLLIRPVEPSLDCPHGDLRPRREIESPQDVLT